MFGTHENNNTELRSDTMSGDVSEVESGLEVTESEIIIRRRENEFY